MMIQGEKVDLSTLERMCLGNDPAIAMLDNKVILQLVKIARAARDYYFAPYCDDHQCGCHEAHREELKEALEEIEP